MAWSEGPMDVEPGGFVLKVLLFGLRFVLNLGWRAGLALRHWKNNN